MVQSTFSKFSEAFISDQNIKEDLNSLLLVKSLFCMNSLKRHGTNSLLSAHALVMGKFPF